MAMAAAWVGAQPPSVKCRICGRPGLRGAKLCGECVAAVKRARDVNTIASQFLPQPGPGAHPSLLPRAPRSTVRRHSSRRAWIPSRPAGWGVLAAFIAFGAAVAATAYLAVQEIAEDGLKGRMAPAAMDPAATRANAPQTTIEAPPRTTGAPAPESAATPRAPRPESIVPPPVEVSPAIAEPPQPTHTTPLPQRPVVPRKAATENGKKPLARASSAASAESAGDRRMTTAAPEPVEVVRAPAPAPDPPVPDRWETMSAALAACSRESFLAGVMCTERVRYQYCEGYWGQVPQCRAATRPGASR